ncbi:hypothetical protein DFP72DRAFT_894337 [Ephemerocybe angulata]|uniref:Uncharacterized protein n=1 Tax=Ephemerocybe angulata TaxID=980116 RepID=A0A8H6I0L3_9AGAR|nr:hypothetical protein DFP72DRAFT_894337 [Tulosesus angulatus]
MLGANVLARRAFCSLRAATSMSRGRTALTVPQNRAIHASAPVLKKKKATTDFESLFDDDDLEIVDAVTSKTTSSTKPSAPSTSTSGRTLGDSRRTKLSPEARKEKLTETLAYMKPRIGRKPTETHPEVRNAAWLNLLQLASSEAEMREIISTMPLWTQGGRTFTALFSESFVRRCQELACPRLALQVYGDYAKYNLRLTLPAARQLLHSLHRLDISELMTASALYGLYNLPAAAQDYVSCAIIVNACLRNGSEDANAIAQALLPHLRKLQAEASVDEKDTYHRENVWVVKSMENIEAMLKEPKGAKSAPTPDLAAAASASAEQTVSP